MIALAITRGRQLRVEVRAREGGGYLVLLDGRTLEVDVAASGPFSSLLIDGRSYETSVFRDGSSLLVTLGGEVLEIQLDAEQGSGGMARPAASGPDRITAPMPGRVARVLVSMGQAVGAGDGIVVIEAMKMENELRAPRDGHVLDLPVNEGQAVESGALLAIVG